MLGHEITDEELVALDAGASTLDPTEQVEGLRARVRRLEGIASVTEEQRKRCRENAVVEAQRRGGPYIFNRWRNWEGTPFDYGDVCAAIVEALTQEGVQAWLGDGTSIVTQMVEAGHTRAVKAEAERDEYKRGVMAVHELCDRANIPHDLQEGKGKVVLVTELPAWKRVEMLVLHWQKLAKKKPAKKTIKKATKSKSRPRGR